VTAAVTRAAIDQNRIGRFLIPRHLWEQPERYLQLLKRFLPVRVEAAFWRDGYEVTAYCDEFDPADAGKETRSYLPLFRHHGDGSVLLDGFDWA
jgi:hypothetical protein